MQLGASGISAAGVDAIGVGIAVTTNYTDKAVTVAVAMAATRIAVVMTRDCAGIYAMLTALIALLIILMAPTIINAIHAQQRSKSILIPRSRRRQLEAEQMPLVVQLLLQLAVHRERVLAAAAPTPASAAAAASSRSTANANSTATATAILVEIVPRVLAASRSGCVTRRGARILFGQRRYVTRYEQYGGRSSRTCTRRRHQDALRAASATSTSSACSCTTSDSSCSAAAAAGTASASCAAHRGASVAKGANRSRRPNAGTRRWTSRVNGQRYP